MMIADNSVPGGLGPWFAALAVFTSPERKKAHVIAHTFPQLVLDALNRGLSSSSSFSCKTSNNNNNKRNRAEEDGGCWVIILKVGPFERWDHCSAFWLAWTHKTRGVIPRIRRGLELWHQHCARYALRLWAQTKDCDEAVRAFFHPAASALGALYVEPDVPPPPPAVDPLIQEKDEKETSKLAVAAAAVGRGSRKLPPDLMSIPRLRAIFDKTQPHEMVIGTLKAAHAAIESALVSAPSTTTTTTNNSNSKRARPN